MVQWRPFEILPENEAFPKEDSGCVLWVILHGPTESNSVEKPLVTFLSIKICLLPGLQWKEHRKKRVLIAFPPQYKEHRKELMHFRLNRREWEGTLIADCIPGSMEGT